MIVAIDLNVMPARIALIDPDVFTGLAVVVAGGPAWASDFAGMVAFASEHRWVDDRGRLRAHVERF